MGVPLLGRIPLDPQIVACGDAGMPYIHRFAESPAAKAFAEVVQKVTACSRATQTEPTSSQTEGEKT
jgi:septum formation inhibitor-activating ATPase MinD